MKEVKELAVFICKLVNAIMESLKDGKISILDAPNFIAPLMSLGEAIGGIGSIIPEINNMDEVLKKELMANVALELKLDETNIEPLIMAILNLALNNYKSYVEITTILKALKK